MRLTLKDEGIATFKKIYRGRKWVGRVGKCEPGFEKGAFYGKIGNHLVYGRTEREAFDLVCANFFGFKSVDALEEHNDAVAYRNKVNRQRAQHVADEMLKGNFKPLDALFGLTNKED